MLDDAVLHNGDTVADGHCLFLIVGDIHGGDANALLGVADDAAHLDTELCVQIGKRLVHQQHIRRDNQCASQCDTLLLTAGKLGGIHICLVPQPDHFQIMVRQLLGLLLCFMMQLHGREGQVFEHRHVRIQIELLEHHAGGLPHQLCFVFAGQLLSVDVDMAAGGLFQKVHTAHGSGFARTGWPDDHQLFAFGHFQVDILQNVQITEVFFHMLQLDHVAFPFSCFISPSRPPCLAG